MLPEVQYPFQFQLSGTGVSVSWYCSFNRLVLQYHLAGTREDTVLPTTWSVALQKRLTTFKSYSQYGLTLIITIHAQG